MREGKLLERQNVALALYKKTNMPLHALWAIESMYQISQNFKESKVLDIAYLLLLNIMKEPDFEKKQIDYNYILLHVKVLSEQKKFKDAVDFIDKRQGEFEDKLERQQLEASLYLQQPNYVLAINIYFSMLRPNSHIGSFTDMWK